MKSEIKKKQINVNSLLYIFEMFFFFFSRNAHVETRDQNSFNMNQLDIGSIYFCFSIKKQVEQIFSINVRLRIRSVFRCFIRKNAGHRTEVTVDRRKENFYFEKSFSKLILNFFCLNYSNLSTRKSRKKANEIIQLIESLTPFVNGYLDGHTEEKKTEWFITIKANWEIDVDWSSSTFFSNRSVIN